MAVLVVAVAVETVLPLAVVEMETRLALLHLKEVMAALVILAQNLTTAEAAAEHLLLDKATQMRLAVATERHPLFLARL
jgi:hypothetical protein